ncbi:fluoroquinolone export ABC transporter permease subunit [Nocardia sp. NBC_01329]|uniref:fluoroquinolone export ABC transporter permease subunit n=1 Tax=Nocardia sp. NBC_01329 TaxID=2903594 RepID=UPI002E1171A4|nr:fluoroquinolone transporter permease [Nocardia sp. NBC_01329]
MSVPGKLKQAFALDLRLQVKYGFVYAAVFSALVWEVFLYLIPADLHPVALPYLVFGDLAIVGFFFIAAAVYFERGERTLFALLVTPMRFRDYYTAKLAALTLLSLLLSLVIAVSGVGLDFDPVTFTVGVVLCTVLFLMGSFVSATPFDNISEWIMPSTVVLTFLSVPLLNYSGLWDSYLTYLVPTQGPLMLLGSAFDQTTLQPWQVAYCVLYPLVAVGALGVVSRRMFDRHIVASQGME